MQKWDYVVITGIDVFFDGIKTKNPRAFRIASTGFELIDDFKKRPKDIWETMAVGQFIAKLGIEGWEMVGTASSGTDHSIYFKRPIP